MNERIRELITECETEYSTAYEPCYDMEKFAELIVRECINIAYEYDAPKMSGPGMIIGNRIEEHFGVEE